MSIQIFFGKGITGYGDIDNYKLYDVSFKYKSSGIIESINIEESE